MLGIRDSTGASEPLQLVTPPVTIPLPIDSYILRDFHKQYYVLSWCPGSVLFHDKSNIFEVWPDIFRMQERARCKYYLCKKTNCSNIYLGCRVYNSMCIGPLLSAQNINVFGRSFGVEFPITRGDTTKTAFQQVSSFEHASVFSYTEVD